MDVHTLKQKSAPIFKRYHITYAGIFGSVARGDDRDDSDVDFLVSFERPPSLVRFIQMENELKKTLHRDVDIVIMGSEKPLIKPQIYKDLVDIYE